MATAPELKPLTPPISIHQPAEFAPKRRRGNSLAFWLSMLLVLVLLCWGGWAVAARLTGLGGSDALANVVTEEVGRGDLLITVTEDGNVESATNTDVKCQVAGGSTILWIIPDGSTVKKGDELVRLNSAAIEDQVNMQKIVYEKAQATRIESEKIFSAAKIAVQEYIEGTYIKELQVDEANITIALENLRSAENSLLHTEKLARKGYVTPLQLDAQKFGVERSKLDLAAAQTTKSVLEKFTKVKMLGDLESARDSAEARMRSEQAACDLEQTRLKRFQTQLEQCTITAPRDGMVVFANEFSSGRGSSTIKIEEGAAVRERQSIVRLPDLTAMQVKVIVHESKVDSLAPGMRAEISIQDHVFQGEVTTVANQPEPTSFFSANVKEYASIVRIDGHTSGLKPGMTAEVEILVDDRKNVLSIPVQAVVEIGNRFFCWVRKGNKIERRQVQFGASNSTMIEIKEDQPVDHEHGLAEGDLVVLNPRSVVPAAREEMNQEEQVDVTKKFGQGKPRAAANRPTIAAAAGDAPSPSAGGSGGRGGNPMALDKDGDKKLSRDEVSGSERLSGAFDKIDANKDGFLDAGEMAAMRARMQQQGGGGPPGSPAEAGGGGGR